MLPVDNLIVEGEKLLEKREYEELIKVCKQILEKEADNEFAIHSMGKAYYYLKNYHESKKYLEKASEKYVRNFRFMGPGDSYIIRDYGKCLLKMGRLDEALSLYDAYLNTDEIQGQALRESYYQELAEKCVYNRRVDDAIKCLDYYLRYKPDCYNIHKTKLDILLSNRDPEEVMRFYDEKDVKERLNYLKNTKFFIKTYDINIVEPDITDGQILDMAYQIGLDIDANNLICRWYTFSYAYALNNKLDEKMAESYATIVTWIFTYYRIENGIEKYYDQDKIIEKIRKIYSEYNEVADEKEKIKPLLDDILNIYRNSFEGYSRKTETIELNLSYSLLEKFKKIPGEDDFNKFRNLLSDHYQYNEIRYNNHVNIYCKHLNSSFRKKMIWKKLYSKDHRVIYEGYTLNNKPCGLGTEYYKDGKIFKEGIFDIKGLSQGKEYYPNGQVRFEGTYAIHNGYGPNYPINGNYYSEDGELLYTGKFKITKGNTGLPRVIFPREYGSLSYPEDHVQYLMWEDVANIEK